MTEEERFREIAAILAEGLSRLWRQRESETSSEKPLAFIDEQSVTGTPVNGYESYAI